MSEQAKGSGGLCATYLVFGSFCITILSTYFTVKEELFVSFRIMQQQ